MQEADAPPRLMSGGAIRAAVGDASVRGEEMMDLARRLYPFNRSLTGHGVRETLRALAETLPLEVTEVPSGTAVYDWTVPLEWNLRDAWIADSSGLKLVDVARSNLHVVGYSVPVDSRMRGAELRDHLHRLPAHPDWIPYAHLLLRPGLGVLCHGRAVRGRWLRTRSTTSSSTRRCEDGSLTYAEIVAPGQRRRGGPALEPTSAIPRSPTTTCPGSWCSSRSDERCSASSPGTRTACSSPRARSARSPGWHAMRSGSTACATVSSSRASATPGRLPTSGAGATKRRWTARPRTSSSDVPGGPVRPFVPWGDDERQFCSPAFDLPVGSLTRTPHGQYPQYHTSADDLTLIGGAELADSLDALAEILDVLEGNVVLERVDPHGEPQLGRRGLYETIGAGLPEEIEKSRQALLWTLNLADGRHSLLDAAERSSLPFALLRETADRLVNAELVRELR